ncbi:hypothetical protein [Clostridium perfringens]|uniref:hypothetical protein n=1 Tax=Clostridium perfringens TaxID=1502 RepID=UPI001ABA5715|nr:hypothetical protein [Clostridium perfringens]MBO3339852.1 hypothetical protein [Clostridium perfringens]MDK0581873.1 hypothetical protein [Clostridium perfringens]MDK0842851.1 hypothetical protein [Clostridium perfringens]MDM0696505.1 hypothetical protein [Clostridium perfringens]MDM1008167.1 hypothetical protein [Clostridium perfringens]
MKYRLLQGVIALCIILTVGTYVKANDVHEVKENDRENINEMVNNGKLDEVLGELGAIEDDFINENATREQSLERTKNLKAQLETLSEELGTLEKGDNIDMVQLYFELKRANNDVANFDYFLQNVDVQMQDLKPISDEELRELLK